MIQCSRKGTNDFYFFGSVRRSEPPAKFHEVAQDPELAALALYYVRCHFMGIRVQRNRTGNISHYLRFFIFQAEGNPGKSLVFQSAVNA